MKAMIMIPAFNEESTLGEVIDSLPDRIEGVSGLDVLVVDDGSQDRTADVAAAKGATVVRHRHNRGVGGAFQSGHQEALRRNVDILITIDADGQFDPGQIPELIAPILAGEADLVTGCRFRNGEAPAGMPRLKHWGNLAVAALVRRASGSDLRDVSCGFRAYGREALLHLNLFGKFTYTQETVLDLTFKDVRIVEVPIRVRYFEGRRSRVAGSLLRYALNAGKIMTRTVRDFRPLRFFGLLGLAVFLVGTVLDLGLLLYYLETGRFSPYKVVGFAGGLLNVAGILLCGLGLLADMLDRIRVNQERLLYHHRKSRTSGTPNGNAANPVARTPPTP